MKISILSSNPAHPIIAALRQWKAKHEPGHDIEIRHRAADLQGGDILFLVSCSEIVRKDVRSLYRHSLLLHGSELPKGRGWSPLVWQVIEGKNRIPIALLEVEDKVDTGAIWSTMYAEFEGHELHEEMQEEYNRIELALLDFAIAHCDTIQPRPQPDEEATYYPRRTPEDSRIDPNRPISQQFELLRVADPDRYPSFFDYRGHRYEIRVTKRKS